MPRKDLEARREYQREYCKRNSAQASARSKKWKAANPEKVAENQRLYAQRHPEKIVEKAIRWKKNNPERAAEISKKTRLKNKGRVVANKAAYRAAKKNRTPVWLTAFDRLKMKCIYQIAAMYTRVNGERYEVDHVIPLCGGVVSGFHVPSNLQIIKASDNRLKNNRYEVSHA